jgi:pectin lyase
LFPSITQLGKSDLVTIDSCHFKNLSGRGPKVGGVVLLHAVNNFFENVSGHSFDIGEAGPEVIVEGSYFSAVTTPLLENKGAMFTVPAGQESKCSLAFGRSCKPNVLVNSGTFSANDQGFLPDFKNKGYIAPAAEDASSVPAYVRAHAGVGKI